jgi:putative endonuclease
MMQHFNGLGSNFTRKYPPVELIYYENYPTIWEAFRREKQVKGWSKKKKEALIESRFNDLPFLSKKLFKKK